MQADPNRQWFVYYNEKEMGPFPEKEILSKLTSSELDSTAYMFTDGLSDWELVTDLPVFKQAISNSDAPLDALEATGAVLEESLENPSLSTNGDDLMDPAFLEQSEIAPPVQVEAISKPDLTQPLKSEFQGPAPTESKEDTLWTAPPTESSFVDTQTKNTVVNEAPAPAEPSPAAKIETTKAELKKDEPQKAATKRTEVKIENSQIEASSQSSAKPRRWFIYFGLAALGVMALLVLNPSLLKTPDSKTSEQDASTTETPAKSEAAGSQAPSAAQAPPTTGSDIDWAELQQLRQSKDPQSPPFRLASQHYGDLRPTLIGVVSPLIQANRLQVAVYPDNERNLMAIPKIWFLEVPVVSGFFSIGPLTDFGEALSPGKYIVAVTANGVWLGEVFFDLGQWPSGESLTNLENNLKNSRKSLAEKEKIALEEKMAQVLAASNQLQALGKQFTVGAAAKNWTTKSKEWLNPFSAALEDQKITLSGPMFFPQSQQKIFDLMKQLEKIHAALDLQVKAGPKAVTQKFSKGVGSLWVDYTNLQNVVRGDIQLLNPEGVLVLKIDSELVKKRLVEFGR